MTAKKKPHVYKNIDRIVHDKLTAHVRAVDEACGDYYSASEVWAIRSPKACKGYLVVQDGSVEFFDTEKELLGWYKLDK